MPAKSQPQPQAPQEPVSFEQALADLEKIVAEMESGDLPLDQTMSRLERGMGLAKFCTAKLGETEKKIEVLMRDDKAQGEWKELTPEDDDANGDSTPSTEA